jgi:hypothetical protein
MKARAIINLLVIFSCSRFRENHQHAPVVHIKHYKVKHAHRRLTRFRKLFEVWNRWNSLSFFGKNWTIWFRECLIKGNCSVNKYWLTSNNFCSVFNWRRPLPQLKDKFHIVLKSNNI